MEESKNNVLEMTGIFKAFAVPVLKGVDFSLKKGEVHALVGGNGAGKSTLMKIMTGVYKKDAGNIFVNGKETEINSPHDAQKNNIAMIFQELSLVQTMTVAENIFLGREVVKNKMRDTAQMNQLAKGYLNDLGIDIDPVKKVSSLSVGLSQMVEIAKAIAKNAKILVFDEPTASLSDSETKQLFKIIAGLKEKGVSMVYISHRMNEILQVADSISILRDGEMVMSCPTEGLSLETIVAQITGSSAKKFEYIEREYDIGGDDLLTVSHLAVNEKLNDISFSLKKGEILGFAGLMGSGRTEIVETLFGIRKSNGGQVRLKGAQVFIKRTQDAIKQGFALIPEDRRKQGLVLIHSVKENDILPKLGSLLKGKIFVNEKMADKMSRDNVETLNIKTDSIHKRINLLSGGNQQKVVLAKWINMDPEVMMLDEPTAGVDIGAKSEIIDLMRAFADRGRGVIFVSSELAELMAVCDRIITLYDGKITGELKRKDIACEEELQYAIQKA